MVEKVIFFIKIFYWKFVFDVFFDQQVVIVFFVFELEFF